MKIELKMKRVQINASLPQLTSEHRITKVDPHTRERGMGENSPLTNILQSTQRNVMWSEHQSTGPHDTGNSAQNDKHIYNMAFRANGQTFRGDLEIRALAEPVQLAPISTSRYGGGSKRCVLWGRGQRGRKMRRIMYGNVQKDPSGICCGYGCWLPVWDAEVLPLLVNQFTALN